MANRRKSLTFCRDEWVCAEEVDQRAHFGQACIPYSSRVERRIDVDGIVKSRNTSIAVAEEQNHSDYSVWPTLQYNGTENVCS